MISREAQEALEAERENVETETPEQTEEGPRQPVGFDFSGVDLAAVDWDAWEPPELDMGPDPCYWYWNTDHDEYQSRLFDTQTRMLQEIREHIWKYYQPEYDKIKDMGKDEVYRYLYETYKMPFQAHLFEPGTKLPAPPNGMSKEEADMTFEQLKWMLSSPCSVYLRDPYAMSSADLEKLDSIESRAKTEVNQYFKERWEAENPDFDPEKQKAERKAKLRKMIETVTGADLSQAKSLASEPMRLPVELDAEA